MLNPWKNFQYKLIEFNITMLNTRKYIIYIYSFNSKVTGSAIHVRRGLRTAHLFVEFWTPIKELIIIG